MLLDELETLCYTLYTGTFTSMELERELIADILERLVSYTEYLSGPSTGDDHVPVT